MSSKKQYMVGDIVLVPFPFSDLSKNKVRPSVVLSSDKEDYVLVFITTSKPKGSLFVEITPNDQNNLKMVSYIRYTKIASLDGSIIVGKIGNLSVFDCKELKKRLKEYLFL